MPHRVSHCYLLQLLKQHLAQLTFEKMFPHAADLPRSHIIKPCMINGDLNKPVLIVVQLHSFFLVCSWNRFLIQENKQNEKCPKLKKKATLTMKADMMQTVFCDDWKPFGARIAQQSGGEQSWHLSNCLLANDCDSSSLENPPLLSVCWNTQRHRDARLNVLHFLLMVWSFSW